MSEFVQCETKIKDRQALVDGLVAMGFDKSHIEVHDQAVSLYGYQGDRRSQKANVIIRRQHVGGSSNDIGFVKQKDGTYKAIISEFDRSSGGRTAGHTRGYNDKWVKELTQNYTEKLYTRYAKKNGMTIKRKVKETAKGKRIVLTLYK